MPYASRLHGIASAIVALCLSPAALAQACNAASLRRLGKVVTTNVSFNITVNSAELMRVLNASTVAQGPENDPAVGSAINAGCINGNYPIRSSDVYANVDKAMGDQYRVKAFAGNFLTEGVPLTHRAGVVGDFKNESV